MKNNNRLGLVVTLALAALISAFSLPSVAKLAVPAETPNAAVELCFYRGPELACAQRAVAQAPSGQDARADASILLEALLAGPTEGERAQGFSSALPEGAQLYAVAITDAVDCPGCGLIVGLALPAGFLYAGFDPVASDRVVNQIAATLDPLGMRAVSVQARDQDGAFRPLSYFIFEAPVEHKPQAASSQVAIRSAQFGALEGKTVYLSAGHGWYWSQSSTWLTQRGVYEGFVEDFNNAEVVNQYLVRYLRNAGADVWPVREHDMNTTQIIVTRDSSGYAEQGEWITGTQAGYNGGNYRYTVVSATPTATATWSFTPAASGQYAVYVWYLHASNRAADAHYLVQHAGGTSEVRINQQVHGATWRYIGTFPFAAGVPARVMLTNQSANAGSSQVVIADAIRIGGGMGVLPGDTPPGYTTSGRPRWEEAARYWAKYQGAPPSVYDSVDGSCSYGYTDLCDDITARPRYAEWETPPGEDAVYISWHTNGYDGAIRGTESYIYLDPTAGSGALQAFVHTTLVDDIRAGWDPAWTDRGMKQRDLGEVRLLSTMPGVLLEIAFHDEAKDANALKDPRFEQLAARAVYKGIVRYFANQAGAPAVFLPEPPKAVSMRNLPSPDGGGAARLDWLPSPTDASGVLGDAATSYRVYLSSDGLGWGNGIVVAGAAFTLTGLLPAQLLLARVTGVNEGGESFPSAVVGARVGWPAPVLIVNGFGRIDRRGLVQQDDGGSLGVNARMFLDRINSFDYVVEHGMAITLPFDSAHRLALGALPLALSDYAIVDWIAGKEQSSNDPLPPGAPEIALSSAEQAALQSYMAGGGALFISGAELGYDLVAQDHGQEFYSDVLRAAYWGDDADTYTVAPVMGSLFDGLPSFNFDDGAQGNYDAGWPDYFIPVGGASSALVYIGGQGYSAGLQYDRAGCARLVHFGFPFEAIYPASTRQAVMDRIIHFLGWGWRLPPETMIQSPGDGEYFKSTPPMVGTASQVCAVDIAAVRLQIISGTHYWDGAGWAGSPTWVTATGAAAWVYNLAGVLADGEYTALAQARSAAGVLDATPASATFYLDTLAPTAPVPITPTGGITVAGVGTTFIYSPGSDTALAGYVIEVDGQPFTSAATTTFNLPIALSDGAHTWRVWAFDRAGNVSLPSNEAGFATVAEHSYLPIILKK